MKSAKDKRVVVKRTSKNSVEASDPSRTAGAFRVREEIAAQLRRLSSRLEAEWQKLPSLPKLTDLDFIENRSRTERVSRLSQKERTNRVTLAHRYGERAYRLLVEARDAGYLGEDPVLDKQISASGDKPYLAFIALLQHWLPTRCPDFDYRFTGDEMGYHYADAFRELSTLIEESRMTGSATIRPVEAKQDDVVEAQTASGSLKLFGEDAGPVVNGKPKPKLTLTQYKLIKLLIDAGPDGLSKDGMEADVPSARSILKKLSTDSDWQQVIKMPGKTGGRYRVI